MAQFQTPGAFGFGPVGSGPGGPFGPPPPPAFGIDPFSDGEFKVFGRGGADLIEGQDIVFEIPDDFIDPFAFGGPADPFGPGPGGPGGPGGPFGSPAISLGFAGGPPPGGPGGPDSATAFLTPEFGGAVSADGTFTDAANFAGPAFAFDGPAADFEFGGAFGKTDFIADPGAAFFDERRDMLNETADNFMAATEARKETVFGLFADAGLVNDGPREFDVTLGPGGPAPGGPGGPGARWTNANDWNGSGS